MFQNFYTAKILGLSKIVKEYINVIYKIITI